MGLQPLVFHQNSSPAIVSFPGENRQSNNTKEGKRKMPSATSLKRYIEKLDGVILSGDVVAAEELQAEVLAVFEPELGSMRSKLTNYQPALFATMGGVTVDSSSPVDFIKDARILRSRLQVELEKIEPVDESEVESVETTNTNTSKPHKLFISHSSKDKAYMVALVEMLEDIGMPDGSFVCTSVPGHGIPGGARIYDWLRDQFLTCDLRVMFALSHNYYKSAVCLNEMGAAWVTKATDTILLLPGFGFSDVDGCVDSTEMGISFGMDEEELKHRLNEFKDTLIVEHNLPTITQTRWERHRNKFIKKVKEIAAERKAEEANDSIEAADTVEHRSGNTDPFDFPPIQLHASVMLFFAAEDERGEINVSTTLSGTSYMAGRNPLNSSTTARELAKWDAAVKELERAGYIEQISGSKTDQIYKVTDKGYAISDRFGSDNQLDASMSPSEVIAIFEGEPVELSEMEKKVIEFLKKQAMGRSEIAEALGLNKNTTSRLLKKLLDAGHIQCKGPERNRQFYV